LGPNDLTRLFQDHPQKRNADIVNDEPEIESKRQPQRNAPRPARFLNHVYAMPLTKEIECFRGNKESQVSAVCEVESKSCVNHMYVFCSCICRASKNSAPSLVSSTEEQIRKHEDGTHRSKRKIAESREDGDKTGSQVPIDVPDGLSSEDIPAGLSLRVMRLMVTRWTRTAEYEPTHLICGAPPMEVDEVALYIQRGQHPILP